MAETTTEAERIRGLMDMHRKDADALAKLGKPMRAGRDLSHADTLERFALPLAEEVDRLRAALSRWGAWCHSPDDTGALFEAAVEGTPAECFPADPPEAP